MVKIIDNDIDQSIGRIIIKIICIFWILAKLISWKLWIASRTFPLIPLFDFFQLPNWMHSILFMFSLGLLLIISIKPVNRLLLLSLVIIELLSCLTDQNRWQPWEYEYLTILFVFVLYFKNPSLVIPAISFVLFSIYLYSGLSKFNPDFIKNVWNKMILVRFLKVPTHFTHSSVLHYAGYCIPLIEVTSSFFLTSVKTRKAGALLLISAHIFILLLIGPSGLNYNIIIWPWNIGMMALLFALFIKHPDNKVIFKPFFNKKLLWVIIVWGLLPATNYIGIWDDYFSSVLYAGKIKYVKICIENNNKNYPSELKPFFSKPDKQKECPDAKLISVNNWCFKEMNVPPYPEERVYKKLEKIIRKRYKDYKFSFTIYRSGIPLSKTNSSGVGN